MSAQVISISIIVIQIDYSLIIKDIEVNTRPGFAPGLLFSNLKVELCGVFSLTQKEHDFLPPRDGKSRGETMHCL